METWPSGAQHQRVGKWQCHFQGHGWAGIGRVQFGRHKDSLSWHLAICLTKRHTYESAVALKYCNLSKWYKRLSQIDMVPFANYSCFWLQEVWPVFDPAKWTLMKSTFQRKEEEDMVARRLEMKKLRERQLDIPFHSITEANSNPFAIVSKVPGEDQTTPLQDGCWWWCCWWWCSIMTWKR